MHAASALVKASEERAHSVQATSEEAARRACSEIRRQDREASWDLAFLFTCGEFNAHFESIAAVIRQELSLENLIGCTAEAVLGVAQEVEDEPAISLMTLQTNGRWLPLHLDFVRSADGGSIVGWPDDWLDQWPSDPQIVLLADPFTFPTDLLLQTANDDHPGARIFGGMASGGARPGDNRLAIGTSVCSEGAVGVAFLDSPWTSVVSQGCRPIGQPLVITKVEANVIYELGGLPAHDQLMNIYESLPNQEKLLAQKGLHLGRVVDEYMEEFSPGDFLIRNVIGVSREENSVSVGDYMRVGQTVQFHLRDAKSADMDLRQSLRTASTGVAPNEVNLSDSEPQAALLFTCNGRGTRLFSDPNHDAQAVKNELGDIPIAGFFAQGEIGPIAGKNFLHGFTASLIVGDAKGLE